MSWCPYFITIACALPYVFASPIGRVDTSLSTTQPDRNSILSERAWSWKLEDLTAEFKGIHWDYAFVDCTPDQLDKVIFSTRAAHRMLVLVANDAKYPYSAAWNRYFGDYPLWYKSGAQFLAVAAQIQRQFIFPYTGMPADFTSKITSIKSQNFQRMDILQRRHASGRFNILANLRTTLLGLSIATMARACKQPSCKGCDVLILL